MTDNLVSEIENTENLLIGSDQANKDAEILRDKDHHRKIFEEWLSKDVDQEKGKTTLLMDLEKVEKIISYLKKTVKTPEANYTHYVKRKRFNIKIENTVESLFIMDKKDNNINYQVIPRERYFDVIYDLHCLQRGHAGVNKMEKQVKLRYYGITREIVMALVNFVHNARKLGWKLQTYSR